MNEKTGHNPPEEIGLLPRDQKYAAPYPPPYSDNPTSINRQPTGEYAQQPGSYPPSSGGYPPPTGGYFPPSSGYPPQTASYPPATGGYPPQTGGYPPSTGGYPPSTGGYPLPTGGYPPATGIQPGMYAVTPTGYGIPITTQPSPWMAIPEHVQNCPPGLEYLSVIDQLIVHQEIELLELVTGLETENKYSIFNNAGQRMYHATESSGFCARNCCGSSRAFNMSITDIYGKPVINLYRPCECQSCCFPCCLQYMEVSSPIGTVIGTIEQDWTLCNPKFRLKNANHDTVLCIKGPCCTMACGSDVKFKLMSADGTEEVGSVSKKWSGYTQELATDADNFGISFPMGLDVKMKAVVLGACFLIDMMYYETAPNQRRR